MTDLVTARQPYIDGSWVSGGGGTFSVFSPATNQPIAQVEAASVAQFESAVIAARRCFDGGPWPRMTPAERVAAIRRLGDALDSRRDLLVETVIQEAGCPRMVTEMAQVGMAISSIHELSDLYEHLPAWEHNEVPLGDYLSGRSVRLSIRRYEPAGVVAAITPYNFPFITNVWKTVPALLAGCAVVLRPSPLTPLEALVFGEAAEEAGFPPGVLNVVAEPENQGAVVLTTHPEVDVVSFTGSSTVGRLVATQAAPTLKRCILELGGKGAALHLPDAFDGGVDGVVGAALFGVLGAHSGQGCSVQARILVPQDRQSEVVEALAAGAANLPIGDPAASTTLIGPLISEAQRSRVDALVKSSISAGAICATGGRRPPSLEQGWFYEPTVLEAPDPANPANQHEFFGPVISVIGYRDIDDAVRIANATDYGLSGGLYTGDLALGLRIAERIRTGTVQINGPWAAGYTPMGGLKQSGYGRERGVAGIREFQELKHIAVTSR
jgi:aldehyde dehydrogenase (NAD+)